MLVKKVKFAKSGLIAAALLGVALAGGTAHAQTTGMTEDNPPVVALPTTEGGTFHQGITSAPTSLGTTVQGSIVAVDYGTYTNNMLARFNPALNAAGIGACIIMASAGGVAFVLARMRGAMH